MKVVALLIALAGAAAHGPAFTDSDAVCSGVHTLNVGQVSGKRVTGQLADIASKVVRSCSCGQSGVPCLRMLSCHSLTSAVARVVACIRSATLTTHLV